MKISGERTSAFESYRTVSYRIVCRFPDRRPSSDSLFSRLGLPKVFGLEETS